MSKNTNTDIWLAGAFAAFTVDLLVYPLDTLKTRIQSPRYKQLYTTNGTTNRALYRGLYQGIASVILATIPSSGAFFTTYEAVKYTLNDLTPPNSTLYIPQAAIHSVASGTAELVSCAILTPAEVIKQNAQMVQKQPGKTKGVGPMLEVLKSFRSQPTKLFRGYTALAARNLPFTGLQFPAFEYLKGFLLDRRKAQQRGKPVDGILERAWITAVSAGLAGSGAAWITTPIDVVKTRIMLAAGEDARASSLDPDKDQIKQRQLRKGGFEVGREVLKSEGVKGLFRGAALRAGWTAIGSGLYLGCYEGGRFYLEDQRRQKGVEEGDSLMAEKWKDVKVGIGASRSQEGGVVKKSAWQDD